MPTLTAEQIQLVLREKIPEGLVVAEHTNDGHFYRYIPTNVKYASVTTKNGILDAPHLKKWAARLGVEHLLLKIKADPSILSREQELEELKHQAILVHQDEFEDAGDIGTRGHEVIDAWLQDWIKYGKRPDDVRAYIKGEDARLWAISRSAEMFCRDFNVFPVASEMKVVSLRHKFAGTLDSLMMVQNILERGDPKCQHLYFFYTHKNLNKRICIHCKQKIELEFSIVDWKTSNSIDKVEYAMQVAAYWQAIWEMTGLRPKRIYIVRLDKTQAKYEVRVLANRAKARRAFLHCSKVWDWMNEGTGDKLIPLFTKERVALSTINSEPRKVFDPIWTPL